MTPPLIHSFKYESYNRFQVLRIIPQNKLLLFCLQTRFGMVKKILHFLQEIFAQNINLKYKNCTELIFLIEFNMLYKVIFQHVQIEKEVASQDLYFGVNSEPYQLSMLVQESVTYISRRGKIVEPKIFGI